MKLRCKPPLNPENARYQRGRSEAIGSRRMPDDFPDIEADEIDLTGVDPETFSLTAEDTYG